MWDLFLPNPAGQSGSMVQQKTQTSAGPKPVSVINVFEGVKSLRIQNITKPKNLLERREQLVFGSQRARFIFSQGSGFGCIAGGSSPNQAVRKLNVKGTFKVLQNRTQGGSALTSLTLCLGFFMQCLSFRWA